MSNMLVTCSTVLLLSFLAWTNFDISCFYLEELLQNVPGARQVFERWMQWEPDNKAWQAYTKMDEVAHDGRNYDAWFDYARLEEGALRTLRQEGSTEDEKSAAIECVGDIYERAVAHVPPGQEKRHWRRYIFLSLDYALFEEIETKASVYSLRC